MRESAAGALAATPPTADAHDPSYGLRDKGGSQMTLQRKVREAAAAVKEEEPESVPEAPEPEVVDATTGTEAARSMAARYLPNCVRLFAGVAFGKKSRAKLHSR